MKHHGLAMQMLRCLLFATLALSGCVSPGRHQAAWKPDLAGDWKSKVIHDGEGIPGWPIRYRYEIEVAREGKGFRLAGPVKRNDLTQGGAELFLFFVALRSSSEPARVEQNWNPARRTLTIRQKAPAGSVQEISGEFKVAFLTDTKATLETDGREIRLRKRRSKHD